MPEITLQEGLEILRAIRTAVQEEREACAKIADSVRSSLVSGDAIAAAIRKRGEK